MADHEDHEETENIRMEKIEKQVVSYHKGVTWLLHLIGKTMSIRCPLCWMLYAVFRFPVGTLLPDQYCRTRAVPISLSLLNASGVSDQPWINYFQLWISEWTVFFSRFTCGRESLGTYYDIRNGLEGTLKDTKSWRP